MTSSSLLAGHLLRTTALGLSIAIAAAAAPAFAQDSAPQDAASDDSGDAPIIVTAQGRSQLLSDVPVAISAVSAETLQNSGANDIRQLNQVAPSLLVSSTGSEANGSARIRGIGTVGDNPGLESSVPVFIDGVYRSRSGIGLNELGEIERVEVQRGPQGTLGGRNSSAGLISIYSKKPSFEFGATGEATYGNYDYWRLGGSVTGPITDTIAARLDGVWVKRDGFYKDTTNDTDVNNRNRYFLRGQLLFEPTDALSIRLIADYTYRNERCCAATYIDNSVNPMIGNLNNPSAPNAPPTDTTNNIIRVLTDLGQPLGAFNQGYDRNISVSPGRSFAGKTKDYGFSGQIDWDLGGATLTSITGYREYRSGQAGDLDYGAVDILYRADSKDAYRQFHTFTQELRLQGEAFDGKLDWLVGGFFANEKLTVRDNLRFGEDYGRFAACRLISGAGALSGLYSPNSPSCIFPGVGPATILGALGPAIGGDVVASLAALDGISDRGSINDVYRQNGRNWALFTHNIFHITDKLDFTFGVRYTNDRKKFSASFTNDNTACQFVQSRMTDDLTNPSATVRGVAGGLIGLACQGNSTAELDGVSIRDKRSEDEWTGTAILSYKPVDDLMLYASFSRGYKAGGFNLDRSALKNPIQLVNGVPTTTFAAAGGAQALVGNLQFDPELVNNYELGAKYSTGPFGVGLTFFRSDFKNFQLNTFNGSVFIVQTVNGCSADLNGGDRDQSKFPGAPNFNAGATGSGACNPDDVSWGVRTEGFELEASLVPARSFRMTAGLTYANTKYRSNLVGNKSGAPLDQALRLLPGNNLSNAPELVATGSVTWTPEIGSSGLTGLVYIDGRMTSDYNTGSDLFPQKAQDGYALFNARVGVRGPDEKWGIELWAQNIFNKNYSQVAFNSPFQEGATSTTAAFADPQYPGGRQIFSQFLAEPRTYGVTLRGKF
ncbi:outer membrane receptor protein involved in Fe transport [Sphingopyxis panaciterrae]|uniref:TonB-dependent receptor n=1 Tax=Sphingopyxis panaciterrae TaxID=363841 RepID=UPI001422FF87|nr:TonB-dependent receptor [Sphingopyxis panaciterrae]NIJ38751.1 outer membrane receptor protein involved in Fe transport [Sphingopyxis panaciterrae]